MARFIAPLLLSASLLLFSLPLMAQEPSAQALLEQGSTASSSPATVTASPSGASSSSLGMLALGVLLLCGSIVGAAHVQKRRSKKKGGTLSLGGMRVVQELELSEQHRISIVQMPDGHRFMVGLAQGSITLLEPKVRKSKKSPLTSSSSSDQLKPSSQPVDLSPPKSHPPEQSQVGLSAPENLAKKWQDLYDTPEAGGAEASPKQDFSAVLDQKRQEAKHAPEPEAHDMFLEESSNVYDGLFTGFEDRPASKVNSASLRYSDEPREDQGRESDSVLIALRNMKNQRIASQG